MNKCGQCPNSIPAMRAQGHDCGFPDCVGWNIEKNPKPIPDRRHDYDFWHDDCDDCDDENRLCGTAESVTAAMQQIGEIMESLTENEALAALSLVPSDAKIKSRSDLVAGLVKYTDLSEAKVVMVADYWENHVSRWPQ